MNSFHDAVTESGTGVILAIEVSPSSGREEFIAGYDPWRRSIRCSVRSPPVQGRANREVIESMGRTLGVPAVSVQVIARAFGIPAASVRIISGATQSRKRVKIEGMTKEAALVLLGHTLKEEG